MGAEIYKSLIKKELVNILDNCYVVQDECVKKKSLNIHKTTGTEVDKKLQTALGVEKYLSLTNKKSSPQEIESYRYDLKKDFDKFLAQNPEENPDSLEFITKVAFQRFVKASKKHYLEKLNSTNPDDSKKSRLLVEKCKKDYELIMSIN